MPASTTTSTESALVSQVMKEVFGVTSDVSSVAAPATMSSQKSSSAAAGSAAEMTAEEEEMAGMSRLLTDEEIRKIIAAGAGGETSNPDPVPPLGNFVHCHFYVVIWETNFNCQKSKMWFVVCI